MQGPLSRVLQQGKKQGQLTCSHDLLDLGPVFPIATGGEGWGGRRASPQYTHHLMTDKEQGQPFFVLWGQVAHTHALRLVYSHWSSYQVQLHCNDWARYRSYSALQRAANSEREGQLYKTLQALTSPWPRYQSWPFITGHSSPFHPQTSGSISQLLHSSSLSSEHHIHCGGSCCMLGPGWHAAWLGDKWVSMGHLCLVLEDRSLHCLKVYRSLFSCVSLLDLIFYEF